jgi:hypothetical protein
MAQLDEVRELPLVVALLDLVVDEVRPEGSQTRNRRQRAARDDDHEGTRQRDPRTLATTLCLQLGDRARGRFLPAFDVTEVLWELAELHVVVVATGSTDIRLGGVGCGVGGGGVETERLSCGAGIERDLAILDSPRRLTLDVVGLRRRRERVRPSAERRLAQGRAEVVEALSATREVLRADRRGAKRILGAFIERAGEGVGSLGPGGSSEGVARRLGDTERVPEIASERRGGLRAGSRELRGVHGQIQLTERIASPERARKVRPERWEIRFRGRRKVHPARRWEIHPARRWEIHPARRWEIHPARRWEIHPARRWEIHPGRGGRKVQRIRHAGQIDAPGG